MYASGFTKAPLWSCIFWQAPPISVMCLNVVRFLRVAGFLTALEELHLQQVFQFWIKSIMLIGSLLICRVSISSVICLKVWKDVQGLSQLLEFSRWLSVPAVSQVPVCFFTGLEEHQLFPFWFCRLSMALTWFPKDSDGHVTVLTLVWIFELYRCCGFLNC